jgi:colanic acid/amylovoran biosynthesis glycosyltransferase
MAEVQEGYPGVSKRKRQNSSLRILFAGVTYPTETFITRLIQGLADSGIEVTIASEKSPRDDSWQNDSQIQWLRLPRWSSNPLSRLWWLSWLTGRTFLRAPRDAVLFARGARQAQSFSERLRSWCLFAPFAGHRWDVIYFPWNSAAIVLWPLFELGCPVVISCRGSQINVAPHDPTRSEFRQDLRKTLEQATAVHCVSHAIKQEAEQYGLDATKAWIIHPAVDTEFFSPAGKRRETNDVFRVVTTGGLFWVKGYEYALTSIRQLIDMGIAVQYDIIGDGPERQRLLYTIHDLDLRKHVQLHGSVGQERVRDLMCRADVFLLSSLSEGVSNAALEAMACGLPVVTTDCGGMRELVSDGIEGFVVPPRQPEAMTRELARLATNPKLRERLGRAARRTTVERFNIGAQIARFGELYRAASRNSPTSSHA